MLLLILIAQWTGVLLAQDLHICLNFDGTDDYVDVGTVNIDFTNGFTIEAHVYYNEFNQWSRIIDFAQGAADDNILFTNDGNYLVFVVWTGALAGQHIYSSGPLIAGQWLHTAVTQDNSGNVKMYIDGVEVASGTTDIPANISRTSSYIARSNWIYDGYFDGLIDEVRIWTTVRTQSEIRENMHTELSSNENGLAAYYQFNEGLGQLSTDNTGNYNGTLGSLATSDANDPAWIDNSDNPNGLWGAQNVTLYNTSEADIMVRTGDIDNLGFGWPDSFNPFSGNSTPAHYYPYWPEAEDATGTDEIYSPSSYIDNAWHDGYCNDGVNPETITLTYNLMGTAVKAATIQLFVDDFQAPVYGSDWNVTIDGVNTPFLKNIINSLSQTGPIGKIVTVELPTSFIPLVADGSLSIFIDDATTGAGDGYAIDFVKLLINVSGYNYTGTIQGTITDNNTGAAIEDALVTTSSIADYSNSSGNYQLNVVPAGQVLVAVSKTGYVAQSEIVDLIDGEVETQDFVLVANTNAVSVTFTNGSSYSPNVSSGQDNQALGRFQLTGASNGASLSGVSIQLNNIRTGASNFKLWQSTDAIFNSGTDTQLGITVAYDPGVGNSVNFTGLSASISTSESYFFIACDVSSSASGQIKGAINNITLENGEFPGPITNEPLSTDDVSLLVEQTTTVTIIEDFTVLPAYPNPFNPSTTISYGLDKDSKVSVQIFDVSGKLITTLLNTEQTQGWHSVIWVGTDNRNNQVPAGIYLSRITSNNTTKTTKLMLLK